MSVTVSRTPLRVSLLGGGTDLPAFFRADGGAALSLAIESGVTVEVADRGAPGIEVRSLERRVVDEIDDLDLDLEREALRAAGATDGIRVTIASDGDHAGRGLGSSAAVIVGLLNAVSAHRGRYLAAAELAELASRVELEALARPVGLQDQYSVAFGGLRFYEFRRDGGVRVERLAIGSRVRRELEESLVLAYTGRSRDAGAVLASQLASVERNQEALRALRGLAYEGRDSLLEGSSDAIGDLLHRSWMVKRGLSERVSDAAIDELYERALDAGALGGKLLGAGAGGYMLLFCPPDRQAQLGARLGAGPLMRVRVSSAGSAIVSGGGEATARDLARLAADDRQYVR